MRKLFLLIPALVFALVTNAETWNIGPTNPQSSDNIRRTVRDKAQNGDIIVLADGTYTESEVILFDKSVTLMPAENAHPVIAQHFYSKVTSGAEVKFIGIKFDGSLYNSGAGANDYCFYPYDLSAGNEIHFENCEFTGFKSYVIYCSSSYHIDSCIINNCYFHDNAANAVYFTKSSDASLQTCNGLIVTNSTFTNRGTGANGSVIEMRNQGAEPVVNDVELTVDHCTFYNNQFGEGDYSPIRSHKLGKMTVTNCIFAHPDAYAKYAVYAYGGSVSNCLTYNLTSGYKNWSPCPTLSDNITGDPLFNDLANNKYTFANNWETMNISPACGAATDGTDLGDPRWHTAPILPSTDFATPYALTGDKAVLSGSIWYDDVAGYLWGDGDYNENYGTAKWKIHAERACIVEVALNLHTGSPNVHKIRIEVLDADGNRVGVFAEESSTLPGSLTIPAAGNYTVILHDDQDWSSVQIDNITLSYAGGAIQEIPTNTLAAVDAILSSKGTYADGMITFSTYKDQEAKWNVIVAGTGTKAYTFTLNINNPTAYGHNFSVSIYENEGAPAVATLSEHEWNETFGEPLAISLEGTAMLEGGKNYIVKVTNAENGAQPKIISVSAAYAGGAAVALSKDAAASLLPNADAIISSDWSIEGGKITHAESKALTGWAKWNVACADGGDYKVVVNIESDNGHLMKVEVFEDEAIPAIYTLNEAETTHWSTGTLAIDLGNITLSARNYVFKVSNTQSSSHVQIASIVISYEGGAVVTIPNNAIPFADAILSENATRNLASVPQEIHFGSPNATQYAKWNVHATAGLYTFTFDVVGTNYGTYKLDIIDGSETIFTYTQGKSGSGQVSISKVFIPADGDYELQLANTNSSADGYLTSLAATKATDVFILDENTEDDGSIAAAAGNTYTFLLKRSFEADRYYTICIPVSSWNSELKLAFGDDYELWQMTSATQSGDEINLNFDKCNDDGFEAGIPYIIKPSVDVQNPIFHNSKTIYNATWNNTQEFTAANFIGTFYKDEIEAGVNNLYLQNNDLYYSASNDTPIKGTRAWIRIKPAGAAGVRARIVLGGKVATDINLVNGELTNGVVKTIENGQLVIIRDGVRYNVMGIVIEK